MGDQRMRRIAPSLPFAISVDDSVGWEDRVSTLAPFGEYPPVCLKENQKATTSDGVSTASSRRDAAGTVPKSLAAQYVQPVIERGAEQRHYLSNEFGRLWVVLPRAAMRFPIPDL